MVKHPMSAGGGQCELAECKGKNSMFDHYLNRTLTTILCVCVQFDLAVCKSKNTVCLITI